MSLHCLKVGLNLSFEIFVTKDNAIGFEVMITFGKWKQKGNNT